jgi:hypothetical protein
VLVANEREVQIAVDAQRLEQIDERGQHLQSAAHVQHFERGEEEREQMQLVSRVGMAGLLLDRRRAQLRDGYVARALVKDRSDGAPRRHARSCARAQSHVEHVADATHHGVEIRRRDGAHAQRRMIAAEVANERKRLVVLVLQLHRVHQTEHQRQARLCLQIAHRQGAAVDGNRCRHTTLVLHTAEHSENKAACQVDGESRCCALLATACAVCIMCVHAFVP